MKNILITGISGMLGGAIYNLFRNNKNYNIYGISRCKSVVLKNAQIFYGDLSSMEFIKKITQYQFDIIFHCAALTNVNLSEVNRTEAFNSNVKATEMLFSELNSKQYVYISTDSVFDGVNGNYSELSLTNPLNYYAETKLLAEETLKKIRSNYYIFRTNIYGFNNPLKNSLFEWGYKKLIDNNDFVEGFANMFFNPLYVGQIAHFLDDLTSFKLDYGTYNLSADEYISKYDFLKLIANTFNFSVKLIKKTEYINIDNQIKRPINTTLNNLKLKSAFKEFDFSIKNGLEILKNDFVKTF